ncbi:MAG: hypothetical protein KatS3mg034_1007 [Vicingaceae bacterium]|nr:MAG: hypothetical protein KatS3mg034_1007 [Vicingaceae bacterium]
MTAYLISLFLHVIFACLWIGGMLFLPLILLPSIKNKDYKTEILLKTGLKFRFWGWIALAGLLITGILNAYLKGFSFSFAFFLQTAPGKLILLKIILYLTMIIILAYHDFYAGKKYLTTNENNQEREHFRNFARLSGRVNLFISLLMAVLGIMISRGIFLLN